MLCDVTAVKVISMFGYFKASEDGILRHHYHQRVFFFFFFLIYSIRFVLTRLQMEVALSILFDLYLVFALK